MCSNLFYTKLESLKQKEWFESNNKKLDGKFAPLQAQNRINNDHEIRYVTG